MTVDAFALASWAFQNREDLQQVWSSAKPVVDLVEAENLGPRLQRLYSSLPAGDPPKPMSVRWMQQALNAGGVPCAIDGDPGAQTRDALKKFQALHKLHVDGWAGPETCAVLKFILPEEKP